MIINRDELQEICSIVYRRNELQKKRNSARSRIRRLDKLITSKRNKLKKQKLLLLADKDKNKFYKKLIALKDVGKGSWPDFGSHRDFNAFMHTMQRSAEETYLNANRQLEVYGHKYNHYYPAKYDKQSLHSLKTEIQKAEMERATAMYEIMLHTEETSKRLKRLLKKNGVRQRSDGSGGVDYLAYDKQEGTQTIMTRICKEEIERIAFDASVEKELGI